eukprot:m.91729 g.91729  ORF g.91729 m.91729 type:complete len:506 (-) comp14911_c0_seq1:28-1545(-)
MMVLSAWMLCIVPLLATATVVIELNSSTYNFASSPSLFAGVNTVLGPVINLTYDDEGLNQAAKALRAGLMRYPGGTVANYWSIPNGNYVPSCTTGACATFGPGINAMPAKTFTLDKFQQGVAGAAPNVDAPIVDLNVYNDTPAAMLAQVDYLAELNVPVPRFELGNEFYITRAYGITAAQYVATIKPVIARIRSKFPNSAIAIVTDRNSESAWNANLSKLVKNLDYDAVTVHDYSADIRVAVNTPSAEAYFMANGFIVLPRYADNVKHFYGADKPIWNTEYNVLIKQQSNTSGSLLANFQACRVLAAARTKGKYATLNFHAFGSEQGVGWDSTSGLVHVGSHPNQVDSVMMGPAAAVFAHTAYFTLENYQHAWVPVTRNNPQLSFTPLTKIPTRPECIQPLVLTKDASLSLPLGLWVANLCPQAHNVSLDLERLTSAQIQVNMVAYPADRHDTTTWLPLSQFDPDTFPWPTYPGSFKKQETFASLADVELELAATTLYYIDVTDM